MILKFKRDIAAVRKTVCPITNMESREVLRFSEGDHALVEVESILSMTSGIFFLDNTFTNKLLVPAGSYEVVHERKD